MSLDLQGDDAPEFVTVGSIYNTEVETPRMDMGTGLVLAPTADGLKAFIGPQYFYVEGDTKSIELVEHKGTGSQLLIVGRNNGPLAVYKVNKG